jgi:hypothetical protein
MSKIQVQTEIDTRAFLAGASALQISELEFLAREINAVITRKKTDDKDNRERQLIGLINQTALINGQLLRYRELTEKLESESLSEVEHKEYLALVETDEQLRNDRVKYLIELSQLRNVSLPSLMEELGLNTPTNG